MTKTEKTQLIIREEDLKIRKKTAPPAKAHEAKGYRRKPKHVKRDSDPESGPSKDGPFAL